MKFIIAATLAGKSPSPKHTLNYLANNPQFSLELTLLSLPLPPSPALSVTQPLPSLISSLDLRFLLHLALRCP